MADRERARAAPPSTSGHGSGDAVDIGPSGATAWLSHHGVGYGLGQISRNEPWHYGLRRKPSIADARACTPTRRKTPACRADQQ
jgi:D-alanyl-D-alanine carboxypeptidase